MFLHVCNERINPTLEGIFLLPITAFYIGKSKKKRKALPSAFCIILPGFINPAELTVFLTPLFFQ